MVGRISFSMNNSQSWITRLFFGLGRLLNVSRKIIVNFVFFTVLFLFVLALTQSEDAVEIPQGSALVLNLNGDIVEQKKEIDPMDAFIQEAFNQPDENPEVLLQDVIDVINNAKNDDRISILVLKLERVNRTGLSKLQDIAKAIEDFKLSGKQVIAIGDMYTQSQYYIASHADKIWLNPKGWMMLDGYGRYSLYFKSALDKLSISQHIFRVGTFKSAVEPYMRDDMSEEAKEANKLWLNDLWLQYKTEVAKQRGFNIKNFDESTQQLIEKFKAANGNYADYALANKWVDALKTRNQMNAELVKLAGENENENQFKHITYKDYLKAHKSPTFNISNNTDKVAVIVAKGTILDGSQKPGTIGGDSTAKLLREARHNDSVKAVVLRVDSPGGSAYASEVIRQEVDLLKAAGKPVVASMGTYAASGGYWISASANKIIAAPSTITGSIGIFGMFMTFENSLDRMGIHTDGVGTTDFSGFGLTRPLSDGMGELIQMNIDRGYHDFISLVAENRNMTLEQVDKIAQGRVWSGQKAKSLGLVDEIGDLNTAIKFAAEIAKLDSFEKLLIEKKPNATDLFLQNLLGNNAWLFEEQLTSSVGPVDKLILTLKNELQKYNEFNDPQGIYSFCLTCSVH